MVRVPSYSEFRPSSSSASRVKQKNRRDGGIAELLLRRTLWHKGLRYTKHARELPGSPDIVFKRARVCVFVDGDFWHGRHWPELQERLQKRANPAYWVPKIARNIERDLEQACALRDAGWTVLRFWETDLLRDPDAACQEILQALAERTFTGARAVSATSDIDATSSQPRPPGSHRAILATA